jgi:hypothetical protein
MLISRKISGSCSSGNIGESGDLLYILDNPNPYGISDSDFFGFSVSISESFAIVGANMEDDAGGTSSGKAYIYNPATGALLHTLNNPNAHNTSANDYFGARVGISDSFAIVGAYGESDAGGASSGKAYIYNPSTGALLHTLNNPNPYGSSLNDAFGIAVGISDSYVIVGAYLEDDAGGAESGKAYIYNPATGALLHTLNNPNPFGASGSDNFAYSVSISNSYAIIGAFNEDDAGGAESGKAYIYNSSTGALLHTLINPNPDGSSSGDGFGWAVSISESFAIVGARGESGSTSGKAYIYNPATGALLFTLDNPNPYGSSGNDFFAWSVAISESYAIVGGYGEGSLGTGKAYIFSTLTGGLLFTIDNPNTFGTSDNDNFGRSVSISESYILVGVYNEDDENGLSSGKAYIY